jgi:hypothetical protein
MVIKTLELSKIEDRDHVGIELKLGVHKRLSSVTGDMVT